MKDHIVMTSSGWPLHSAVETGSSINSERNIIDFYTKLYPSTKSMTGLIQKYDAYWLGLIQFRSTGHRYLDRTFHDTIDVYPNSNKTILNYSTLSSILRKRRPKDVFWLSSSVQLRRRSNHFTRNRTKTTSKAVPTI